MELTVYQMLQQGVAAHNAGNLQEAERLYRAILQVQPKHPDANHNLGLIAVAMDQSGVALALFQSAIDVNPNIEQFWLSYIGALVKEEQFENAKQVLEQGKKQGVAGEKLNAMEAQLASLNQTENVDSSSPSRQQLSSLSEHYQNGRYDDAEKKALLITQQFPGHQFGWKVLGALLEKKGMKAEALNANQKAVQLVPQDAEAHNNLGVTLQELGRVEEAEESYRQAIAITPDYAEAHNNLGATLQGVGRLEEAEASYSPAIALKPDFAEAHSNLGNTLKELGRLEEAEASCRQAIALKPDFADAHSNLGSALLELGRLEEAEASLRQAIALKYDYAQAHSNLGSTLLELGRLEEAEVSLRQAIALKYDYAQAHSYLGIVLYINGDIDSGIESLEKAKNIDPNLESTKILLTILQARKARGKTEVSDNNINNPSYGADQFPLPFFANRVVEAELITNLYEMNSRKLDVTPDTRYGNGRCSPDYKMFEDDRSVIKTVASDLISIMKLAVKSDVFVADSFFNIYGAGCGITPHMHLMRLDTSKGLNLAKQKYSLVYYLAVGDQNCSEPGILKLYDPDEEILPSEGMIAIFPADRKHSAVYGGEKDRVMIGVNFYSL